MTLPDSAFQAQNYEGVDMGGCVVLLVEVTKPQSGESSLTGSLVRGTRCQVLDWYARRHSPVVRGIYAADLLSLLDAIGQGNLIATAIEEIQAGMMSARQLPERHSSCERLIEHDAGIEARAVCDRVTAPQPRAPAEKLLFLHALAVRELKAGHLSRLWWFDTRDVLPDGLTKGAVDREALVAACEEGVWRIVGGTPVCKRLMDEDRGAGQRENTREWRLMAH